MHIGIVSHVSTEQLADYLELSGGEPSGTDGATAPNLLIIELLKCGHSISVFSLTKDLEEGMECVVRGEQLTIYFGAYQKRIRQSALSFFNQERKFIKNKILQVKPEVLHAHWQYEYAWAALDTKIPTIVTCRDSPIKVFLLYKNLYRFIRLLIALIVFRKSTVLTATSAYLVTELKKLGIKKKIHVIPNFEPDWLFEKEMHKADLQSPKIIMINNGFDDRKNVTSGLLAFQLFRNKYPNAELHLFGNGYDIEGAAYAWATSKNLNENVYYRGYMSFVNLMEELSSFTLLVHPSREETFGNILTESMALGVPVIGGINSGSVPWVIGLDQTGGLLVDIEDPKKIFEGMERIVENESKYSDFRVSARRQAFDNFSAHNVVNLYSELYLNPIA
ncbi:glycosyltransferase family 4 protein [Pedobacter duraquae]|uniref:Glycosyltransferase involved in cell wall biosynthesis n=1 Tax=Pedobacter duraquae TaxID=425511 RepID=A0A4R6IA01_9SPHI|nr:glycosyltransferase family 4 protein [Pedobacter duraquae]TDO19023.1 glycosyltransferase involved in cell wall biosynthesis [Pedobacter duraquae]